MQRPTVLTVALVLIIVGALPFLVIYYDGAAANPGGSANGLLAVLAGYLVFAVLAFRGSKRARTVVTVACAVYFLIHTLAVVQLAARPEGLPYPWGFLLLLVTAAAASITGVVLLYHREADDYLLRSTEQRPRRW